MKLFLCADSVFVDLHVLGTGRCVVWCVYRSQKTSIISLLVLLTLSFLYCECTHNDELYLVLLFNTVKMFTL